MQETQEDAGSTSGWGPGNPPQYSCLENPMDRGTWRAIVHRVTESETTERLSTVPRCMALHLVACADTGFFTNWRLVATACQASLLARFFQQCWLTSCLTFGHSCSISITFSLLLHLLWGPVMGNLWCYYNCLWVPQTSPIGDSKLNGYCVYSHCSSWLFPFSLSSGLSLPEKGEFWN